ncbi:uncharacterized protein G2W53_029075 [Senna tora]|uniref:Uncharacterized protein n=1 Tax=Senna tora TaxID=362788 RepID=A0A834WDD7_9FABA|nr:uncharacterized protein G2W53_029075 [Senna tora]
MPDMMTRPKTVTDAGEWML